MASNPYVNKVVFGSTTLIDLSGDDVQESDVRSGVTFHLPSGEPAVGTASGGGGNPVAEEKTVNFIDYDGTIRYSYTAAEFGQLSALPANPTHTGRIAQGWNWTLAQINAQLAACPGGPVWVGQQYTTSDGKTHIRVLISADTKPSHRICYVRFEQTVAYGVTVDWDDGTTESHSATSQTLDHTYTDTGEYDITLEVTSGTMSFTNYGICNQDNYSYLRSRILDIAFGDNVTSTGENTFQTMFGHPNISFSQGVAVEGYYLFGYGYGLSHVILSSATTAVSERAFRYCYGLNNVSVPAGVTSIGVNAFYECESLRSITIPVGVTSIGDNAFYNCHSLESIHIPSSITSIGSSAFYNMAVIAEFHIHATTPPTLGSGAFNNIPSNCVIYVPPGSGNTYKQASGWSSYASKIQEEAA